MSWLPLSTCCIFCINFNNVVQSSSVTGNLRNADGTKINLKSGTFIPIDPRISTLSNEGRGYKLEAEWLYKNYRSSLRGLMITYGMKSDAECMLGRALRWHPMIHDHGKARIFIEHTISSLFKELREFFSCKYGHLNQREKWKIACVWYDVAHVDGSARSFSIVLADVLGTYLKSVPQSEGLPSNPYGDCIHRAGNSFLAYCLDVAEPNVTTQRSAKLLTCSYIKRALERKNLEGFSVRPYGSVAQALCDIDSDLDVCIDFGLSPNSQMTSAQAHILTACGFSGSTGELPTDFFKSLSKQEREAQLLSLLISPALESISTWKQDVTTARVPIVQCIVPSLIDMDQRKVQVDISCCTIGVMKTLWLKTLFKADPSLYCTFLILLRWAREAELIRVKQGDRQDRGARSVNIVSRMSTGQENEQSRTKTLSMPLFAPAEFHALILHVLKDELQSGKMLEAITDFTPTCSKANKSRVARLVLSFFKNVQTLCAETVELCTRNNGSSSSDSVQFVWPFFRQLSSAYTVDRETKDMLTTNLDLFHVRRFLVYCEPARHCILSCGDVEQLFKLAAGDSKIMQTSLKLSLALSHRIGHATEFHSCRFAQLSGCHVEIVLIPGRPQLLLNAEGSRRSLYQLKDEITNCSKIATCRTGAWCRVATTNSSRYFMESASDIRMIPKFTSNTCTRGSDVQIKFLMMLPSTKDADTELNRLLSRSLNEITVCRDINYKKGSQSGVSLSQNSTNNPFSSNLSENWQYRLEPTHLALVKSLASVLTRQISVMPSLTEFESVRLSLSFGHFLVVNPSLSLPASRKTLSLNELKVAMDKCGRRRQNWEREDPRFDSNIRQDGDCHTNKSGSNEGILLTSNHRKKKNGSIKRLSLKPGIQTTFLPTFSGNPDDLFRKFAIGLTAAGYSEKKNEDICTVHPLPSYRRITHGVNYSISVSISKGYEVRADFIDSVNNAKTPSAIHTSERPLNWVHYTLLGNGELADMRIKLRSTVPISERLKHIALGNSINSPILWRTPVGEEGDDISVQALVPVFSPHTDPYTKKKLIYIRHHIAEKIFTKKCETFGFKFEMCARTTLVREFLRKECNNLDFNTPVKKAELVLDFSVEQVSELNITEMEQFSCSIIREGIHLAQELNRQNVKL